MAIFVGDNQNARFVGFLALVMTIGMIQSQACLAQINPFGWDPNSAVLTDRDWHLLSEATVSLNRTPKAFAGETRTWDNTTSRDSGKITLVRAYESKGTICHQLHYTISFFERPGSQDYHLNWCRTSGGEWKIDS